MSGHSKWNNIKRKKGASDAAKAKVFTKVAREMSVAVKEGGPDPETNGKLRDCIAKAKAANMPNEKIERCIRTATRRWYTRATVPTVSPSSSNR